MTTNGHMWVFCLNVGQADTTLILTPGGKVILIDVVRPKKVVDLLTQLGRGPGTHLDHVIVTHPHSDHYSGVVPLLNLYDVAHVTLSSIWRTRDLNPGYSDIINTVADKAIPFTFLSGLVQQHPDGSPLNTPSAPRLELLGPSYGMLATLDDASRLNPNHRSIIARLQMARFNMIVAGDAQMENWHAFDAHQMLEQSCDVLRSAHHGSANGTQYERLNRLNPKHVIVSSDPWGRHKLPDLIGCAVLRRYARDSRKPTVALTEQTGTVMIDVRPSGSYRMFHFGEGARDPVPLNSTSALTPVSNPTNWDALLQERLQHDE